MTSGIYIIRNKVSEKFYIGSSKNIEYRWASHKSKLKNNYHSNIFLQNSWNYHNEEDFEWKILEVVQFENLAERERFWLTITNAVNKGYNICPFPGKPTGVKVSDKTRALQQKIALEREFSEETRQKFRERMTGKGNVMYGKRHKKSSKEKMKYLNNGELKKEAYSGENNPFYGRKHTEETKKKISEAKKKQQNKGNTKLTIEDVKQIKKEFRNKNEDLEWKELYEILSKKYPIGVSGLRKIKHRVSWSDIE